ncbi:hypothetical protein [Psychrobacillus lasiicapitis]|uniref:Uncharacterized protein n=1 Tax=Psychrobacillus lasiicapitis TaxID=1636719 RepID=A0A544SZU4_9BACI|nr:hypothetical protein [Psychrobacillus lasiicapitis]TQR10707.1 hypothetical protein FG382_16715 [Psychrobacillus lasiicapitis]GGA43203.1 hypothetical protein GCM10011384_36220 [Psychrobacillus lasiicapitis]
MLSSGSIICEESPSEVLELSAIKSILNAYSGSEIFDIAWEASINPWVENTYAMLNLHSGKLVGHEEFTMKLNTSYLILRKIRLQSLNPGDILNEKELMEFHRFGKPLQVYCENSNLNLKQRVIEYESNIWAQCSWYWEAIITESLDNFYDNSMNQAVGD